jgi:hypothetical protein
MLGRGRDTHAPGYRPEPAARRPFKASPEISPDAPPALATYEYAPTKAWGPYPERAIITIQSSRGTQDALEMLLAAAARTSREC